MPPHASAAHAHARARERERGPRARRLRGRGRALPRRGWRSARARSPLPLRVRAALAPRPAAPLTAPACACACALLPWVSLSILPLHRACGQGHLECARLLLEAGAGVNLPAGGGRPNTLAGQTPLHEACDSNGPHEGHLGCARLLLEARAHVDAEANIQPFGMGTPLHMACYNGHLDLARLLVEAGADLRRRGRCARPARALDGARAWPPRRRRCARFSLLTACAWRCACARSRGHIDKNLGS